MSGTTHQMFALTIAFWVLTFSPTALGPLLGTLAIVAVMVGALTPDLDHPSASIWRRFLGGNHVGNIFNTFSGGHRHMTHSLLGIAIIAWGTNWLANNIVHPDYVSQALILQYAFMIGYISHPILDTFTDWGVPWLWPLHPHLKIPPGPEEVRVTTNSFVETIIVRGGLIVVAMLLLQSHWHILRQLFS